MTQSGHFVQSFIAKHAANHRISKIVILEDFYQIFAELSVAFAGFAGVVGAFSKFRVVPEAVALRVRFLVTMALTVLVGSLLPPVLIAIGFPESVAIRVCAFFIAICMTGVTVWAWRGLRPLQRAGLIKTQIPSAIMYAIVCPFIIALSIVAVGGLAPHAASIYLGALFAGIASCCWYFILRMFSIDIGRRD